MNIIDLIDHNSSKEDISIRLQVGIYIILKPLLACVHKIFSTPEQGLPGKMIQLQTLGRKSSLPFLTFS